MNASRNKIIGLPLTFATTLTLCVLGGLKLDEFLGTSPLFLLLLLGYAIFAIFYISIKTFLKDDNDKEDT